jgi:hypothetical protein
MRARGQGAHAVNQVTVTQRLKDALLRLLSCHPAMSNAADNASRRSTPFDGGGTAIGAGRTTTPAPTLLELAAKKGSQRFPALSAPTVPAGDSSRTHVISSAYLLTTYPPSYSVRALLDRARASVDDRKASTVRQAENLEVETTPRATRPQRARTAAPPRLPSLVSEDAQDAASPDESGRVRRKRRRRNSNGDSIDTTGSPGTAVLSEKEEDAAAQPAVRQTTGKKVSLFSARVALSDI